MLRKIQFLRKSAQQLSFFGQAPSSAQLSKSFPWLSSAQFFPQLSYFSQNLQLWPHLLRAVVAARDQHRPAHLGEHGPVRHAAAALLLLLRAAPRCDLSRFRAKQKKTARQAFFHLSSFCFHFGTDSRFKFGREKSQIESGTQNTPWLLTWPRQPVHKKQGQRQVFWLKI